jgi:hypothetical protein
VTNTQSCDFALPSEELIGLHIACGKACLAARIEAIFTHRCGTLIGDNTGGDQAYAELAEA